MTPKPRKIHAQNSRDAAPPEKFTRKIHATDVSRMHFAWENGTLKLQAGPGPPPGKNSREKFTRNSRDEVPPFGTLFLTLIFEPSFGRPGSTARKIHAKNSRDASGHSCVPFSITFWPCFLGLSWQVAMVSHVKSKSTPLPRHAPNGPQLDTRHPADW